MNEFLPLAVLVAFTASVTAVLIVGVIRVVVATDRPRRDDLDGTGHTHRPVAPHEVA